MKNALFIALILMASTPSLANCGKVVSTAYQRGVRQQIASVSPYSIVQRLIQMQIDYFFEGKVRWKTFYPFWVFRHREAIDLLVASLPGAEDLGLQVESREFTDLESLLKAWEDTYIVQGGDPSRLWDYAAAKRFKRQFYLELAFRYSQAAGGLRQDSQPRSVTRESDHPLSYLAGFGILSPLFGEGKDSSFERLYLDYVRNRERIRTPRGTRSTTPAIESTFQALGGLGLSRSQARAGSQPDREQDLKQRQQDEVVTLVVNRIRPYHNRPAVPLVAMMYESADSVGFGHFQTLLPEYELVLNLFGSWQEFMTQVNARLVQLNEAPIVSRSENWAQELLIQAGVAHELQGDEITAKVINTNSRLFRDAGLNVVNLVTLIERQTEAVVGEPD